MPELDRERFLLWLENHQDEPVMGPPTEHYSGSIHIGRLRSCRCPIARYAASEGFAQPVQVFARKLYHVVESELDMTPLPDWAIFVVSVTDKTPDVRSLLELRLTLREKGFVGA